MSWCIFRVWKFLCKLLLLLFFRNWLNINRFLICICSLFMATPLTIDCKDCCMIHTRQSYTTLINDFINSEPLVVAPYFFSLSLEPNAACYYCVSCLQRFVRFLFHYLYIQVSSSQHKYFNVYAVAWLCVRELIFYNPYYTIKARKNKSLKYNLGWSGIFAGLFIICAVVSRSWGHDV